MEEKAIKKKKTIAIKFPMNVLKPIGDFLRKEVSRLEKRVKEISEEDPFKDTGRVIDNAAPDVDALEQIGHQRTVAIRNQIERRLIQIKKALARMKIGKYGICEVCGNMIDTERLMVMPEATICAKCAKEKEE